MAERKPDVRLAQQSALSLIERLKIEQPPVDPMTVAKRLGITVEPSDKLGGAFSGCLMRSGETFGIMYSVAVASEGFQRFTVAHELGHHQLIHQHEWIFRDDGCHYSISNFSSNDWFEVEADHFAAELLMPEPMFRLALRQAGEGMAAIKRLSDIFITSLPSTAIRFARHTYDPAAIVMSRGNTVDYCFTSEALGRLPGVRWGLRKDDPLPTGSATYRFNQDSGRVTGAHSEESSCHISEWFTDCRTDLTLNEDVIGLGIYGKTLTVLFTEVVPDSDGDN